MLPKLEQALWATQLVQRLDLFSLQSWPKVLGTLEKCQLMMLYFAVESLFEVESLHHPKKLIVGLLWMNLHCVRGGEKDHMLSTKHWNALPENICRLAGTKDRSSTF